MLDSEMNGRIQPPLDALSRSKDDEMVAYLFQRPDIEQFANNKRWVADENILDQARTVSDIEREFHSMNFSDKMERDPRQSNLMFQPPPNLWNSRQDSWPPSRIAPPFLRGEYAQTPGASMMPTGQPRLRHSFQSTLPPSEQMLSPRSSETGALGVNMAEYVLGGPKVDARSSRLLTTAKPPFNEMDKLRSENGSTSEISSFDRKNDEAVSQMMHGQNLSFSRQYGMHMGPPSSLNLPLQQPMVQFPPFQRPQAPSMHDSMLTQPGINFETLSSQQYVNNEEYTPSHMVANNDSPAFADYALQQQQNMQQQQQQQQQQRAGQTQIALMAQPPYQLQAQQQMGMQTYAPTSPYIINTQDNYGMQIPGASMLPQYYSAQPPWPIYVAAPVPQQQQQQNNSNDLQQLLRQQRPQTPHDVNHNSQQEVAAAHHQASMQMQQQSSHATANYQILAPAFYDQTGQFMLGGGRGLSTPVRLVSPAPILVNTATGQQGYAQPSGLFTPVNSTPLSLTPQSAFSGAYIAASSTPSGTIGRDIFGNLDFKSRQYGQYIGAVASAMSPGNSIGFMAAPNQSMTPPNLSYGVLGLTANGRAYPTAPGAEKLKYGPVPTMQSNIFGTLQMTAKPSIIKNGPAGKEGAAGRSQLLEDFRNNLAPNLQLKDLVGHLIEFSQDQHGSRFIQQKLERASVVERQTVFAEILPASYNLMTDVFGNYVIQKFFEFGTQEQKQALGQKIRGHVLPLALQMYGCRIVQKALETLQPPLQTDIVRELEGHVQKCVKDQNGNHVVQKCIECVEPGQVQFIIDAFKGQVMTLSAHPYGCRIIQRMLEHCTEEQTAGVMEELHEHCDALISDQYGNYVIQHILEHGRPEDKSKIVALAKDKVLQLSQHKFASNVMEKCVAHASRAERAQLIDEVCNTPDGQSCALFTMMKDQFANYVVQRMIDVADMPQRKHLITKLRPHVSLLRKYTYGKHILAKIEKYYMKNSSDLPPIGVNGSSI